MYRQSSTIEGRGGGGRGGTWSKHIITGSFGPTHRELLLAWTGVVSKNLDNFLMLLCVKKKPSYYHTTL